MGFLEGKIAIVTGAARGLGNAFARALASEGASLAVCDVQPEFAELKRAVSVPFYADKVDVGKASDVHRFVEDTRRRLGGIDVLVNNAGVWAPSYPTDPIDKSLRDYETLVGTNLRGAFLCGRAVMPALIERGAGDIVNISSDHVQTCGAPFELSHDDAPDCPWAGQPPRPTGGGEVMDLYDASKWAINGLTLAWSQALEEFGIRVNTLCVGVTDTGLSRSLQDFGPDRLKAAARMRPDDVAGVLIDLLREGPDGRTGDNIGLVTGHRIVLPPARPSPYVILGQGSLI